MVENEDDFDAMVTAAALLRAHLDGNLLADPTRDDPIAEGGFLLGTKPVILKA